MLLDEVTATVPDTVHGDAERVIVWAGSNDVLHERTTDDAGQDIGELLAAVEVAAPGAELVVFPAAAGVGRRHRDEHRARGRHREGRSDYARPHPALDGQLADDGVHRTGARYETVAEALAAL